MCISGSFSNLIGDIISAHLHGYSAPGVNSGVVFGLSFTGTTSGTFFCNGVINQIDIPKVLGGLSYINIHTAQFPPGEIRGQLVNPVPEPSAGLMLLTLGIVAIA